jgi:hypothetical protein
MHGSKLNKEATTSFCQSYSEQVVAIYFEENENISGQQIISVSPNNQVNFFVLRNLFDQWQEETKKFKSPFFNYKNGEVSQALKALVNTLSKNIQIGKEDFEPLLTKATEDALHLMYDPSTFFINILDQIQSKDKIKEFKLMGRYIKIYRAIYEEILDQLTTNGSNNYEKKVLDVVENHEDVPSEQQQMIEQFNDLLTLDVLDKKNFVEAEVTEEKPSALEDDLDILLDTEGEEEASEITENNIESEFEPFNEQEDELTESQNITTQYSNEVQTLNDTFEEPEKIKTVADANESQSLSSIKSNININQRYMFVHDLFEGNDRDYEIAMDEVEHCDSFDSSVELLVQKYSKKYEWDMNSDEVKEMLKVIFKQFR